MNVLVIGDSCTDVFIRGRVDRLCPEAPVPVINPIGKESNLGMAGNVYENVKSLSPDSKVTFIKQENNIKKIRYVDTVSGYILLRVDEHDETTTALTCKDLESYFITNGIHPKHFDMVLVSDYNKGFLTAENMKDIFDYFEAHGVTIFLDTKKILGPWSKKVDFVKINEKEYKEQCKHIHYSDMMNCCKNLIVTLGSRGCRDQFRGPHVFSDDEVEVMDVSGAGDTYFAAFALRWKEFGDRTEAMMYANKAAGVAVSKRGVVAVKNTEIT